MFDYIFRKSLFSKSVLKIPKVWRSLIAGFMGAISVILINEPQSLINGFKYIDRIFTIGNIQTQPVGIYLVCKLKRLILL